MKLTAVFFTSLLALAGAQRDYDEYDPEDGPIPYTGGQPAPYPQQPYQQRPPPGYQQAPYQQAPPPGYQQAPPPGYQQGPPQGAQAASRTCGLSCLTNQIKTSGCKPAQPPQPSFGPEGPPADWQPPRADQNTLRQTTECFCRAPGLQQALDGCSRQECSQVGQNVGTLVNSFNQMCAGIAGYTQLRG